jgi:hypothetical protein
MRASATVGLLIFDVEGFGTGQTVVLDGGTVLV